MTNFFHVVERNRAVILSTLPEDKITGLLRLRDEMLEAANLNRRDEDSDEDAETAPQAANAAAATTGETDEPVHNFPPITRDLLVSFLKLEKFRLQKIKKVRTVNNLLQEFIEQSDLSKE